MVSGDVKYDNRCLANGTQIKATATKPRAIKSIVKSTQQSIKSMFLKRKKRSREEEEYPIKKKKRYYVRLTDYKQFDWQFKQYFWNNSLVHRCSEAEPNLERNEQKVNERYIEKMMCQRFDQKVENTISGSTKYKHKIFLFLPIITIGRVLISLINIT